MSQPSFNQATESSSQPSAQPGSPPMSENPPTPPRPRRKKLRLVLLVVAALLGSLIGYSLVTQGTRSGGTAPTSERPTAPLTPGETQPLSVFDLQDGDCYVQKELPPSDGSTVPITSVELAACTTEHNAQVITKLTYKSTDNFQDIMDNRAEPECSEQYLIKVQPTILTDSAYKSVFLTPRDQNTWTRRPFVACVLVTSTPTVGSALIL